MHPTYYPSKNKYLSNITALFEDYRSFSQALTHSSWMGRIVSLLTAMAYGPTLVMISEFANRYWGHNQNGILMDEDDNPLHPNNFFFDDQHSYLKDHTEKEAGKPPLHSPDYVFDDQHDLPERDPKTLLDDTKAKLGKGAAPTDDLSDEALAKLLQQEEWAHRHDRSYTDPFRNPYREDPYTDPLRSPFKDPYTDPLRNPHRDPYTDPLRSPYRDPFRTPTKPDPFPPYKPKIQHPLSATDDDDQLSLLLEKEFYANKSKGTTEPDLTKPASPKQPSLLKGPSASDLTKVLDPRPDPLTKDPTPDEEPMDDETMLKTVDGAKQILTTQEEFTYREHEVRKDPTTKKMTFYDFYSGKSKAATTTLTTQFPHTVTIPFLRRNREANINQYLMLLIKQFGNILELKGRIHFLDGMLDLESFNGEELTMPMVASSYDKFSKKSKFFKATERDWIVSQFKQAVHCELVTKQDVGKYVTQLHDPKFEGPLLIITGYIGHSNAVMFAGDYFLYFDRDGTHAEPGIHVFHVSNRQLITEEFLWKILKREAVKKGDYDIVRDVFIDLNAPTIIYQRMSEQITGNCAYASIEAVLQGFMALRVLLSANKDSMQNLSRDDWRNAFAQIISHYDKWVDYTKKDIFNEVMTEIEEWLDHKTKIGQIDLRETFKELLNCWIRKPGYQDHNEMIRVLALQEKLALDTFFKSTS